MWQVQTKHSSPFFQILWDGCELIYIGINGKQHVRDLWRQTDLPDVDDPMKGSIKLTIPAHGVQLYRFTAAKQHSSTPATR